MNLIETFQRVKEASRSLVLMTDGQKNQVLMAVADAIVANQDAILEANAEDLALMDKSNPLYDRLQLTPQRLTAIAEDMRHVAQLPSPLGRETNVRTLPNGLRLRRVSVPFGVVGVVYEARPNVTFDVFALCLKSGNACVLKGGRDAQSSNAKAVEIIHEVLDKCATSHLSRLTSHTLRDVVALLPATHEATAEMLGAVGYIDVCIPRGGRRLIDFVRDNARVPVIETGAGVVNTYFDAEGDLEMGKKIILNAKTRRVSVCNALDCLLIHKERLDVLDKLVEPLLTHTPPVTLYCDELSYQALADSPLSALYSPLIKHASAEHFGTEFMDYKMAVKTVTTFDEALEHIARYGSGHSESIITDNSVVAREFQTCVDAACVYWNAPTSFTDGAQFGLGAEIGISTQKLGPRGPMGLEELCTYKWLIEGEGQTRP